MDADAGVMGKSVRTFALESLARRYGHSRGPQVKRVRIFALITTAYGNADCERGAWCAARPLLHGTRTRDRPPPVCSSRGVPAPVPATIIHHPILRRPPVARRRSAPTAAWAYKPAYTGTRPHSVPRAV